jgi:hypothetical protein
VDRAGAGEPRPMRLILDIDLDRLPEPKAE